MYICFLLSFFQDLDDYHCQIAYRDPDVLASGVSHLHAATVTFLKQLLIENPELAHAIITEITAKGRGFAENNEILQMLYIDLLEELLLSARPRPSSTDPTTCVVPETAEGDAVYQLLSFMDPSLEMLRLSDHLEKLFEELIKRTTTKGTSMHLDKERLYSCLLGRSTTFLIDAFCRIENRIRFQSSLQPNATMNFQTSQVLSPTAQICYSQSFVEDRKWAWQQLFFHSQLERNHFLENMVVSNPVADSKYI